MGQFFHKKSGSQEDNQTSILGYPHLLFGRRGRLNFVTLQNYECSELKEIDGRRLDDRSTLSD